MPLTNPIASDDITILWAAEAELHGRLRPPDDEDETQGQRPYLWVEGWTHPDDFFRWPINVAVAGAYRITVHHASLPAAHGAEYQISSGINSIAFTTYPTHGWIPDWGAEWSAFTKFTLTDTLHLDQGVQTLDLRATSLPGEGLCLYTLELTPWVVCDALDAIAHRARQDRACTDWFIAARYGLSFHWTPLTQPRYGTAKTYPEAVREFDVEALAATVATTGAGYVIFTSSHQPHYFPAPIAAIEKILPGNTCERDLIGDLADALHQYQIRLILYYAGGRSNDDTPEIPRGQVSGWTNDRELYYENFRAIFSEIGERYGAKIAGYWFDFCPFNASHHFESLYQAAKTGYADRLIAWNSWLNGKPSDFQEIWAGEAGEFLSLPEPEHYQDLQPHTWFFLDDEWVHENADTAILPPRFKTDELIEYLRTCAARRIVVSMNVGIYQDGTLSPATLMQLGALKTGLQTRPSP